MKRIGILASAAAALAMVAGPALAKQPVTPRMAAVKLAVADFERTTQFYSLLGMQAGPHHNEWEWELKWDDPAKGSSIIMVRAENFERFHVTPGGGTIIIGVPDLHAALDRLKTAGFAIEGEPHDMGFAAIIMIQDPDGNWIELAGPGTGAAPAKPAGDGN